MGLEVRHLLADGRLCFTKLILEINLHLLQTFLEIGFVFVSICLELINIIFDFLNLVVHSLQLFLGHYWRRRFRGFRCCLCPSSTASTSLRHLFAPKIQEAQSFLRTVGRAVCLSLW